MIANQSDGKLQEEIGLGLGVGVIGEGVSVGSPGSEVAIVIVDELVAVGEKNVGKTWEISGFLSAKEIASPPPTIIIDTRAARNPEISSRRPFMVGFPPR